jgi:uncharacterized protein (TIGR00251 family)
MVKRGINKMAIQFDVKVIPSSGRLAVQVDKSGVLKCYLKSQAEKGKANQELIKFFAQLLHTAQENVSIVSGFTSRKKRMSVCMDISYEQLLSRLHVDKQTDLFDR